MVSKTFAEESKLPYGRDVRSEDDCLTKEELSLGCLQRIANAAEKIAGPYEAQLREIDYLKKYTKGQDVVIITLRRRIAALRGVISRMKKKGT